MDGIGRYLYHLLDSITKLAYDDPSLRFTVLEVDEFKEKSVLRALEDRKNIKFVPLNLKPLGIKNHFLQSRIDNLGIDLIHYGQFDLPWFLKIPAVTTIHDLNPQFFPGFFEGASGKFKQTYSRLCNYAALAKSKGIIAISANTKNELLDRFGKKYDDRIKVIYEGVDSEFAGRSKSKSVEETLAKLRSRYDLTNYFLYVGNNRPHKNIKSMLEAFSAFKQNDTQNFKFVIAGNMMERFGSVREYSNQYGLTGSLVQLTPDEDELIALYKGSRALVYCSLSEGFGLPILEAMQLGTPVLTSDVSSMSEIAGDAAIKVNPVDIPAITKAMNDAASDKAALVSYSQKGILRAAEFTWEKCAEKTLNFYLEILKIK